jgi:hypothetical protein
LRTSYISGPQNRHMGGKSVNRKLRNLDYRTSRQKEA